MHSLRTNKLVNKLECNNLLLEYWRAVSHAKIMWNGLMYPVKFINDFYYLYYIGYLIQFKLIIEYLIVDYL